MHLQEQQDFHPESEKKSLIIYYDEKKPLFQELDKKLNGKLKELGGERYKTVATLGLIEAPSVHILPKDTFQSAKKQEKAFRKAVGDLENDALLLVDTFPADSVKEVMEQTLMAAYRFERFKPTTKDENGEKNIHYTAQEADKKAIDRGIIIGEAVNNTRDLVNTPYNHLNAEKLAEYAKKFEQYDHVKLDILEKEDCEKLGMGAFLAVNAGSKDPLKLIHLEYEGAQGETDKTGLVGKGIMYDTGGYSLKSVTGMPSMKMDMGGAATVLGAFEAIVRSGIKKNVSVTIAATDNKIGDDAHVPDDIITSAAGKTIEIISTDAEGRLTLADALWYAQKKNARRLIDVATLTGAVVGALGKHHTGAFSNNDDFYAEFKKSACVTKEGVWRLPVCEGHHNDLKSKVADMKNSGGRVGAGASIAGAFLEKFVDEDIPWIHLDIAGTAYESETGAKGTMVRTIAHHLGV